MPVVAAEAVAAVRHTAEAAVGVVVAVAEPRTVVVVAEAAAAVERTTDLNQPKRIIGKSQPGRSEPQRAIKLSAAFHFLGVRVLMRG